MKRDVFKSSFIIVGLAAIVWTIVAYLGSTCKEYFCGLSYAIYGAGLVLTGSFILGWILCHRVLKRYRVNHPVLLSFLYAIFIALINTFLPQPLAVFFEASLETMLASVIGLIVIGGCIFLSAWLVDLLVRKTRFFAVKPWPNPPVSAP